jgi:hypothetical protein
MDVKAKEVDQKSQSKLVCVTPLEYTFLICYLLEVDSFTHMFWCPVYSLGVYVRFSHVCEMITVV